MRHYSPYVSGMCAAFATLALVTGLAGCRAAATPTPKPILSSGISATGTAASRAAPGPATATPNTPPAAHSIATAFPPGEDKASLLALPTRRFSNYDDPGISVTSPTDLEQAAGLQAAGEAAPATPRPPGLISEGKLLVRVFASPGVPAENLEVTVYRAGDARQPIDWRRQAQARFSLPPGRYDALVQTHYAQEWLRGLEVKLGDELARDVTFDFGTLELTVLQDGKAVPVDVVTYPAGNRQNWVDWRSDNPATIRLRKGDYDIEIAYDDYQAHETVTGLKVRAGEKTERTVTLRP